MWDTAATTQWPADPQWFHGDVAADNLLTRNGQLTAVIDFGTSGIGDPACDTVIAWTDFDAVGRAAFRRALSLNPWMGGLFDRRVNSENAF